MMLYQEFVSDVKNREIKLLNEMVKDLTSFLQVRKSSKYLEHSSEKHE